MQLGLGLCEFRLITHADGSRMSIPVNQSSTSGLTKNMMGQ